MELNGKHSRREFLKRSFVSAAVVSGLPATAFGAGVSKTIGNVQNDQNIQWNEEWDVLIVGSGFAGSAAFCEAVDGGAKTLMIDKMPVLGGNSAINGGAFAVVNSAFQKARGIKDSSELYLKDVFKAGLNLNDPALVETIAQYGSNTFDFTRERGVVYRDAVGHFGGHSVARSIWPTINSGSKITIPLQTYGQNRGGVTRTRVILDDYVFNDKGRVIGAKVREEYQFNFDKKIKDEENTTGETKYYKMNGGIIMASGGFAFDPEFVYEMDPTIPKGLDCTNHYGATAQAVKMMMKNDVDTVHLNWIQMGPWGSPDEKGFGIAAIFAIPAYTFGIAVDQKTGKRFMNELADRRERSDAIFKVWKDDKGNFTYPIVICDSIGALGTTRENVDRGLNKSVVRQFDTIEEIAKFYNIPEKELMETIKTYRGYVKAGKDTEFGKPIEKYKNENVDLTKPPYYAFRVVPKLHHTMGGVRINKNAQVISKNTQGPIPGLFAAGEATGGAHGASRLGSCAIPDCLVFGRIAAQGALQNLKKA